MVAAMMSPPKEGEASYKQYSEEKAAVLASLKRRATKLCDGLNRLEGVTCAPMLPFVVARVMSARSCLSGAVAHVACNLVRHTCCELQALEEL